MPRHARRTTPEFPPLTISSAAWLECGSDAKFRSFIYKVLALSSLLLQSRERFAARIGVSGPQYAMLVIASEETTATVGLMAERMGISPPFVTAEVGKLARRGLLVKRANPADARSNVLLLSPTGRQLLIELAPLRREINDMIYGDLNAGEVQALTDLVGRLHERAARAIHLLDSPEHQGVLVPSAMRDKTG